MRCKFSEQTTFWLIFELASILKPQLQSLADKYSLTSQQFHVLGYLRINKEPQTMSNLASILFCDASNITGIVDRMIAIGAIERVEHPKDRRVKLVRLTKKGAELYTVIMGLLSDATEERIGEALTPEEKEDFRTNLIKILDSAQ